MRETYCEINGNRFEIQYRVTTEGGEKNILGFVRTAQDLHFSITMDGNEVLLFKPGISKDLRKAIADAVVVDDMRYANVEK